MRKSAAAFVVALTLAVPAVAQTATRTLEPKDFAKIADVRAPELSPDESWVAYTVTTTDLESDKKNADVWMARVDGSQQIRLTSSKDSESSPRWSPDGKWLAFLSSRGDEHEVTQLWLLDRRGGEAQQLTTGKGSIADYVWSPDSSRVALVIEDPDPEQETAAGEKEGEKKTPKPIVIDRFQFKQDRVGYLTTKRQHLYVLDVATKKVEAITAGNFDEHLPSWSPDGTTIAFVSNRGADPDRDENFDVWLIDAKAGAEPRRLTTYRGADADPSWESRPAWRPDGKAIAYLQGGAPEKIGYAVNTLAVIPVSGGAPRIFTPTLDRNVSQPVWTSDGKSIYAIVEEDRRNTLMQFFDDAAGRRRIIVDGPGDVLDFSAGKSGRIAILTATTQRPAEIAVLANPAPRVITHVNDAFFSGIALSPVEPIEFKSKDGTEIHGYVVKPAGYVAGRKYPTALRIHGGPVGQFSNNFSFEWQLLAANGYAVVAANPRGSSGRGEAFAYALWADWGNKDVEDVLASVDHAVRLGIADPDRLGIGGWSYGGMLTNYTIARDQRFKAATSGASISNILAGYGTDQYIRDYEAELGPPWKNVAGWLRISYPFFEAPKITTPTLFLCGESDFNVPLLNSEQMYQALRSLGVPTQLVIYPKQFHGISKPTYVLDRYERYLSWYAKYLK